MPEIRLVKVQCKQLKQNDPEILDKAREMSGDYSLGDRRYDFALSTEDQQANGENDIDGDGTPDINCVHTMTRPLKPLCYELPWYYSKTVEDQINDRYSGAVDPNYEDIYRKENEKGSSLLLTHVKGQIGELFFFLQREQMFPILKAWE
jgi:hypothetical protein